MPEYEFLTAEAADGFAIFLIGLGVGCLISFISYTLLQWSLKKP
jgi:hypothetical protein